MTTGRVQQRGQVTLPKEIRDLAGIGPGDLLDFRVVGPHKVAFDVIPVKPLEYFWEKFQSDEPYDDDALREGWQTDEAERLIDE